MANQPPLTIRKPETLRDRIAATETDTIKQAAGGARAETRLIINGRIFECKVTPSVKPGRIYTLFYVDGRRTRKADVSEALMPAKAGD